MFLKGFEYLVTPMKLQELIMPVTIVSRKPEALPWLSQTISFLWQRKILQGISRPGKPCFLPWPHLRVMSSDRESHLLSLWKQEGLAWAKQVWNTFWELVTINNTLCRLTTAKTASRNFVRSVCLAWVATCVCLPGNLASLPSFGISFVYGSESLVFKSTLQLNWPFHLKWSI